MNGEKCDFMNHNMPTSGCASGLLVLKTEARGGCTTLFQVLKNYCNVLQKKCDFLNDNMPVNACASSLPVLKTNVSGLLCHSPPGAENHCNIS